MESLYGDRNAKKHLLKRAAPVAQGRRSGEQGIALVTSLIIAMVAFLLAITTVYLVRQSTIMSGAGKLYATAEEAGDGALQIVKDYIVAVQNADDLPAIFESDQCIDKTYPIGYAIIDESLGECCNKVSLPGISATYTANVCLRKLFAKPTPGGRIVFGEQGEGAGKGIGQFYRITTRVENSNTGTVAENVALYRFMPE